MPSPNPNRVITQIQVAGGNLYQIAAQYLGDATQWNRIAALNGLLDPMLTGNLTLLMPVVNKNASSGGILIPNPGTPPITIVGSYVNNAASSS